VGEKEGWWRQIHGSLYADELAGGPELPLDPVPCCPAQSLGGEVPQMSPALLSLWLLLFQAHGTEVTKV
jgi:hypothetical protein